MYSAQRVLYTKCNTRSNMACPASLDILL